MWSFLKVIKIQQIVLGFLLLTWNKFFCLVWSLIFSKDFFNPFYTAGLFLFPIKKLKSFSDVFRGIEKD